MKEVLILGQGIAGTVLSATLQKKGINVTIIDSPSKSKASQIASGLYNPIVLKRMKLVHFAEEMMRDLHGFYEDLENILEVNFFHPSPIHRIFHDVAEQNDWFAKSDHPDWKSYLGDIVNGIGEIKSPHGMGIVNQTGWVNTRKMLNAFRTKNKVIEQIVEAKSLVNPDGNIIFDGKVFDALVFAEGWLAAKENVFYPVDVFRPSKGELLEIKISPKKAGQSVLHFKHFLIPVENDVYKTGATYVHGQFDETTTPESAKELMNALRKIFPRDVEITVLNQMAGVRAATKDRRPLIGKHPEYSKVFFMNGLGSRSILMSPYLSNCLVQCMLYGSEIPPSLDINRFF
ncbi:MAG: FAD-dependent oxidoreductase [Cryomorphaceae bacterium]|nr:FAD-dependent oxidoreductase [Cryomorphaceae bacterium]